MLWKKLKFRSMAENNSGICLMGLMNHLWFHHLVLFTYDHDPSATFSDSSSEYSSFNSLLSGPTLISDHDEQSPSQQLAVQDGVLINVVTLQNLMSEGENTEATGSTHERSRPTKLDHVGSKKARSHPSSPSSLSSSSSLNNKRSSRSPRSVVAETQMRLQKTMSCKSLYELELEEVKGFMDLGFNFTKENLSKRMMSVIPGLQRLELNKLTWNRDHDCDLIAALAAESHDQGSADHDDDIVEDELYNEEMKNLRCNRTRPYLSEAWLIRRPDSPLLKLRPIPRVSTAADMKKHLKYWARTVASAIHQQS